MLWAYGPGAAPLPPPSGAQHLPVATNFVAHDVQLLERRQRAEQWTQLFECLKTFVVVEAEAEVQTLKIAPFAERLGHHVRRSGPDGAAGQVQMPEVRKVDGHDLGQDGVVVNAGQAHPFQLFESVVDDSAKRIFVDIHSRSNNNGTPYLRAF